MNSTQGELSQFLLSAMQSRKNQLETYFKYTQLITYTKPLLPVIQSLSNHNYAIKLFRGLTIYVSDHVRLDELPYVCIWSYVWTTAGVESPKLTNQQFDDLPHTENP